MRSVRPHVSIVINHANEPAQLLQVLGCLHLEDGINLFLPWFKTSWSEPVAKPICLLNSPLTFEGIDGEAVVLQFCQDCVK